MLYLETGWTGLQDSLPVSAELEHKPVLQHYSVPQISLFGFISSEYLLARSNHSLVGFRRQNLFSDYVHPNAVGHGLIYLMISKFFQGFVGDYTDPAPVPRLSNDIPPVLFMNTAAHWFFNNPGDFQVLDPKLPSSLWRVDGITFSNGWRYVDEQRGKWGVVSLQPGSLIVMDHIVHGALFNINYLQSYENIGKFRVSCRGQTPMVIDCKTLNHVSVDAPVFLDTTMCTDTIIIETLSAEKVKISSVAFLK